ncbi:lysosomal acid phosphatase [Paragonimus westermani]|uniref:acid phosphatase n=1 Tax=Paragonimus westermani TaxID=34504 RepID=A0A5J4N489_9TREM|nr:lysosomal acid phosphatase [Paragonimus westermani]
MFAVILLLQALSLRFSTSSEENILTPNRSKLLQIFLLSRHGDRSPIHILPKDPYKDHWVQGYGQLTTYGAEQHMALGKFIRSSYSTFISPTFHKDEAFFRSSGTDRTLMSANSFIRGLYPQQLSNIQPPVYSLPIKYDHLLKMSSDCPKFHKMYLDLMNSKEVNRSIEAFEETIDVLRKEYAELFPADSSPADQIRTSWKICDTLGIWAAHQLSLRPSWLTDKVVEQCGRMLDFKQRVRFSTPSLTRFRGGPLIAHVLHLARTRANLEQRAVSSGRSPLVPPFMSDLVESVTYRQQLVAYFAHDSTLAAVMSHLKIFNGYVRACEPCLMMV